MKVNKYLPFVIIYFFVNTIGLPFGLTWMALLAPFFYVWILLTRKKEVLLPFLAILLPFLIMHIFIVGVDLKTYLISFLNFTLVYIFCQAVYTFLKKCNDIEKIFRTILVVNFIICLVGIVFYFTPWYEYFWIRQELTSGVTGFLRFKMFTYEASYYATLFTPIFFFFLLQYIFGQNNIRSGWLLLMLLLPLIISFSLGVIAAITLSIFIVLIIYFRQMAWKKRVVNAFINISFVFGSLAIILIIYFRHNPFFKRITNVFTGTDSSAKGRTEEAFYFAQQLLDEKNEWWGIGLGQIKLLGHDLIKGYYLYYKDFVATIPNAMAETLAIFGWFGFFLKLLIEIFLFLYTKVWTNYYRLMLFVFVFIYQFTGSFITNMAEYMIWILAFTNVFKQFDVKSYRRDLSMTSS